MTDLAQLITEEMVQRGADAILAEAGRANDARVHRDARRQDPFIRAYAVRYARAALTAALQAQQETSEDE